MTMPGQISRLTLAAATIVLAGLSPSAAAFTLDGDASSMTLVAEGDSRQAIIAAIAQRFDLEVLGASVDEGQVSGRFSGSLSHVLRSVLAGNGYAIAYDNGRPVKVTFTPVSSGGPGPEMLDGLMPMQDGDVHWIVPATNDQAAEQPTDLETMMQRQAAQQAMPAPPPPPPPSEGGSDMQGEIAAATAQALQQLKVLTEGLQPQDQ